MIVGRLHSANLGTKENAQHVPAWIARPGVHIEEVAVRHALNGGVGTSFQIAAAIIGAIVGVGVGGLIGSTVGQVVGGILLGSSSSALAGLWAKRDATLRERVSAEFRVIPSHVENSPQWQGLAEVSEKLNQLRPHLPEGAELDAEAGLKGLLWDAGRMENADMLRRHLDQASELYGVTLNAAEAYDNAADGSIIEDALQALRLLAQTLADLDSGPDEPDELDSGPDEPRP